MIMDFLQKRKLRKKVDQLNEAISAAIDEIELILANHVIQRQDINMDRLRAISVAGTLFACSDMRAMYGNDEALGKALFYACLKFAPINLQELTTHLSIELAHPNHSQIHPGFWPSDDATEAELTHVYMTLIDLSPTIGKMIISAL